VQTFETLTDLEARVEWSAMPPRRRRIPAIPSRTALVLERVKLAGTTQTVRPGDRLLFFYGTGPGQQVVREVASGAVDAQAGWVDVALKPRGAFRDPNDGTDNGLAAAYIGGVVGLASEVAVLAPGSDKGVALVAAVSFLLGGTATDTNQIISAVVARNGGGLGANCAALLKVLDALLHPGVAAPIQLNSVSVDAVIGRAAAGPPAPLASPRLLRRSILDGLAVPKRGLDGIQPLTDGPARGALLRSLSPRLAKQLYPIWRGISGTPVDSTLDRPAVYLIKSVCLPFGATAPPDPKTGEFPIDSADRGSSIHLESIVDGVAAGSLVLVDTPASMAPNVNVAYGNARIVRCARAIDAHTAARRGYGVSGRVTRVDLARLDGSKTPFTVVPSGGTEVAGDALHAAAAAAAKDFPFLRSTTYRVDSVAAPLAAVPIEGEDVGGRTIELDGLFDGLAIGRWIVVAGERTDIQTDAGPVTGVLDAELALVAGVAQTVDDDAPGDHPRTVVTLENSLAFTYARSTTTLYGNVVEASHGESASEILGAGNAQAVFQTFTLKRAPLTFLPAPTTGGAAGTQVVRVAGLKWHEVDALLDAGPRDRSYALAIDATGAATVMTGDGQEGARLPSGNGNVTASYRVGLGNAGNVDAGQLSMLVTRPLGVRAVLNPVPASGGADRDGPELVRQNAPLETLTLAPYCRLVSTVDYEYFARQYAGIGQAAAAQLSDGAHECVYVTVAGVEDALLRRDDALLGSLQASFEAFGDPQYPVVIGVRDRLALFVEADVHLVPDADWDDVEPRVRARLLARFSFEQRRLGQSAYLSEVVAQIQSVAGVDRATVTVFGALSEVELLDPTLFADAVNRLGQQRQRGRAAALVVSGNALPYGAALPARRAASTDGRFAPAQIAYLVASLPATLILNVV
jgi:hypothetical protein